MSHPSTLGFWRKSELAHFVINGMKSPSQGGSVLDTWDCSTLKSVRITVGYPNLAKRSTGRFVYEAGGFGGFPLAKSRGELLVFRWLQKNPLNLVQGR